MIGHVLNYTCDIVRDSETGTDPLGAPETSRIAVVSSEPCLPLEKKQSAYSDAQARFVQRTVYALLLRATVAVQEGDIVTRLTSPEGDVDTSEFTVKDVVQRRGRGARTHHITVELEGIGP